MDYSEFLHQAMGHLYDNVFVAWRYQELEKQIISKQLIYFQGGIFDQCFLS